MRYSEADWAIKRDRGLVRFLLMDGIIITGGPFAVVLQVVGYFFLRDEGQTFGQYFSASRTWITFFFHATLFGLIMGYVNWWRNEREFAKTTGEG
ncbi:MAG TPA: hypothetical protein PLL77_12370 [Pyrinomonadaceae bacterium]|nr:hypothetical protein [Pyrinomonadaceae bacterium]